MEGGGSKNPKINKRGGGGETLIWNWGVLIYQHLIYLLYFSLLELLKLIGTFFNLSISNISTLYFK